MSLYDDGEFTTEDLIRTDDVDHSRLDPVVRITPPPTGLQQEVGIPLDQLRFVVFIEDHFLKKSVLLHEYTIGEMPYGLIRLGPTALHAASWRGDTRVHVAITLSEDQPKQPGIASRTGSWLARKTFRITAPINTALFPIEPVDEDWFVQQGLPSNTTYFIQIMDDDFNQATDQLPYLVRVFASKQLMSALSLDEKSLVSRALMGTIYTDIVTTILIAGFKNLDGEPDQDSVLNIVVERLAKDTVQAKERVVSAAREADGSKLRAIVQAQAQLTRAMISATKRRNS